MVSHKLFLIYKKYCCSILSLFAVLYETGYIIITESILILISGITRPSIIYRPIHFKWTKEYDDNKCMAELHLGAAQPSTNLVYLMLGGF